MLQVRLRSRHAHASNRVSGVIRGLLGVLPRTVEEVTRETFVERLIRPAAIEHDTVVHRSLAAAIDLLPFVPLILIAGILRSSGADVASGMATAVLAPLPAFVAVILHSRGGQTFGKQACGIRVVDNRTGARPSAVQALLRSGPELCLGLLIGIGEMAITLGDASWSWAGWMSDVACFVLPAWVVAASAAALGDPRRRALHDRLAGTVVIREALTAPHVEAVEHISLAAA